MNSLLSSPRYARRAGSPRLTAAQAMTRSTSGQAAAHGRPQQFGLQEQDFQPRPALVRQGEALDSSDQPAGLIPLVAGAPRAPRTSFVAVHEATGTRTAATAAVPAVAAAAALSVLSATAAVSALAALAAPPAGRSQR